MTFSLFELFWWACLLITYYHDRKFRAYWLWNPKVNMFDALWSTGLEAYFSPKDLVLSSGHFSGKVIQESFHAYWFFSLQCFTKLLSFMLPFSPSLESWPHFSSPTLQGLQSERKPQPTHSSWIPVSLRHKQVKLQAISNDSMLV